MIHKSSVEQPYRAAAGGLSTMVAAAFNLRKRYIAVQSRCLGPGAPQ
jgi:hypothetical protein